MNIYNTRDAQITIPENNNIKKIYLELSSECNFDCKMCFRNSYHSTGGLMSEGVLERVKSEIEKLPHLQEVVLGGIGEPLMHPQISDIISYIKSRGIFLSINTNGSLLHSLIDFLVKYEVDKIVLSFETGDIGHPPEKSTIDSIKKIIEKRNNQKKGNPIISVQFVVNRLNIPDLTETAAQLLEIGVTEIIISNLLPVNKDHCELILYPGEEPDEIKQFKSSMTARLHLVLPYFEIKTERFCNFIEQNAIVLRWDGEIAPCYRFLHAGREIVLEKSKEIMPCSFGNIKNQNLLEIWNEREYTWFRFKVRNSLYPSCIDCKFRDGCSYLETTEIDCWGNRFSCADCLWFRGVIICP